MSEMQHTAHTRREGTQSAIIIGGGLGGLQCGYILAKNGFQVTVLEHDTQIGGCLQSFRRKGVQFDTGFHYVGGLGEGQSLHGLFRYFDLLDLPWVRMDADCFDEVTIGTQSFPFAQGHDAFVERLAAYFPHEKEGLRKYVSFLKQVGDHLPDSFLPRDTQTFYSSSLFARSAYQFLCDTIHDPLLRKVLSGTSLKMELDADTLPLYVFAQINNSFIQSAWRLQGGGQMIANKLAESIEQMGGMVRTRATVTRMEETDGRITGVEVNGEEMLTADWVISDIHPVATLELLQDSHAIRKVYRNRISRLPNAFGMFTANISLKPDTLPYLNHNVFVHATDADLWHVRTDKVQSVMMHTYVPEESSKFEVRSSESDAETLSNLHSHCKLQTVNSELQTPNCELRTANSELRTSNSELRTPNSELQTANSKLQLYASSLDLLTPMHWRDVMPWADTRQGRRGEDYVAFKNQTTEACLQLVEQRFPELRGAIDRVYTSTPLSYYHYTRTYAGSAYGIKKDFNSPMTTVLTPRTPVQNLLLTGQNLNLHGILGVSMTSVFTCAEILGMDTLTEQMDVKHWR